MNLLPLATWLELMGFHPFHGFGIAGTGALKADTSCNMLLRRYAWQNSDAASHVEIQQAIETAETKLRQWLGYGVAPRYTSETAAWPPRADGLLRWGAVGGDGRWLSVQLSEGEIRAVGVETLTAISTNVAVVYSDTDGDGIDDTFTVTAATTATDTSQIAVYVSAADRFDGWGSTTATSDRWRLLPVQITISGGTVTVRGSKVLCVRPIKYEGVSNIGANGLEPTDATNFVTTLDLYTRTTSGAGQTVTTSQVVITWETRPSHGWWCCCSACSTSGSDPFSGSAFDPAAVAQAVARVGVRDATLGLVTPAEAAYDSTTGVWSAFDWSVCDVPDRVTVRYLAGYPLAADGQMQEPFKTIVARLAAAELGRPVCGCEAANRELARWQFDLARSAGANDEAYGAVSQEDLANPFGTRRGHVHAWRQVKNLRHIHGILA